jgi:isoamylase
MERKVAWTMGEFAMRLCGSEDLYHSRSPCSSINFVTSHDGFTLADLVSYNTKHNLENGESNFDGTNDNYSWNCGIEGPTSNPKILALRERQMRNFHLALMLSQGVPMLLMGDEYGHTKQGNNNTWCQDNELNWFLWNKLEAHALFYRFYRNLIHFRKKCSLLKRTTFLTNKDVDWHGLEPYKIDWGNTPFLAFTLKDYHHGKDLYAAFNAQDHGVTIRLPPPPHAKLWRWIVNTNNPSPNDIFDPGAGPLQKESDCKMSAHSALLLEASI